MNAGFLFGACVLLSLGTLLSAQREACSSGAEVIETVLLDYVKETSPPSLPVNVSVEIWIQRFVGFDELVNELTFDVYVGNRWVDKRLNANNFKQMPISCEEGQSLSLDIAQQLWSPNLNFIQSRKLKEHHSPTKNTFVIMYRNGTVWTNNRYELTIPCMQNTKAFPFTRLQCQAIYESYSYNIKTVNPVWPSDAILLLQDTQLLEFQFDRYEPSRTKMVYPAGEFAELTMSLFFNRNWGAYIIRVYLPAFSAIILVWLGFFFGAANVTARSLLSMFAIAVLTYLFHTSSTTAGTWFTMLHLYLATCLAFAVAAACELAVVSMVHRRAESANWEKERRSGGGRRSDGFLPISTNDSGSSRRRNRCPTVVDMSAAGLFMLLFIIFNVAYFIMIALVVLP